MSLLFFCYKLSEKWAIKKNYNARHQVPAIIMVVDNGLKTSTINNPMAFKI